MFLKRNLCPFLLIATVSGTANAATVTVDVIATNAETSAFNLFSSGGMNSAGTVSYPFHALGAGPFDGYGVATIDTAANVDSVAPFASRSYGMPIINDAGQVLTVRSPDGQAQLLRIEADDSITPIAIWDFSDPANGDFANFGRYSMNSLGEVALEVTTLDGRQQIVKFTEDGSGWSVVAETTGELALSGAPDINDLGVVAFAASHTSDGFGIYTGDGTTTAVRSVDLEGTVGAINLRPDLNNDGDILINANNKLLVWENGSQTDDLNLILDESSGSPTISQAWHNSSDEIAYVVDGSLFMNGERVLGVGDSFENGTITNSHVAAIEGLNENGQVLIVFENDELGPSGNALRFVVRVNPEGTVVDNPNLPTETLNPGDAGNPTIHIRNIVPIFVRDLPSVPQPPTSPVSPIIVDPPLPVPVAVFADPIVATGFIYSLEAGAPNFAGLYLPDPLSIADNLFTLEFIFGGLLQSFEIAPGNFFDFTYFTSDGISQFSILGIDPAAGADPNLPFTVGLSFVEDGFRANLFIDAITVDTDAQEPSPVPLPAPVWMLGSILIGLHGWRSCIRRRKRV